MVVCDGLVSELELVLLYAGFEFAVGGWMLIWWLRVFGGGWGLGVVIWMGSLVLRVCCGIEF